jgi:hypothetical protein
MTQFLYIADKVLGGIRQEVSKMTHVMSPDSMYNV